MSGEVQYDLQLPSSYRSMTFSPIGNDLVVNLWDSVMVYDANSALLRFRYRWSSSHNFDQIKARYSDNGRWLGIIQDTRIDLLDSLTGVAMQIIKDIVIGSSPIIVFSPDSKQLLLAGSFGFASIFGIESQQRQHESQKQTVRTKLHDVKFLKNMVRGLQLAFISGKSIMLYELSKSLKREPRQVLTSELDLRVGSRSVLELSPDGSFLALSDGDAVEVWKLIPGEPALRNSFTLPVAWGKIQSLIFSPDSTVLALEDAHAQIEVFDLAHGISLHQLSQMAHTCSLAFSTDATLLVVISGGQEDILSVLEADHAPLQENDVHEELDALSIDGASSAGSSSQLAKQNHRLKRRPRFTLKYQHEIEFYETGPISISLDNNHVA